jgi:hypothetical protein
MQDPSRYQTASEVLDCIRTRLSEPSQDDLTLLLNSFGDQKLNVETMSPRDEARLLIQEQTKVSGAGQTRKNSD